jgi:PKD repeat protein
VAFNVVFVNNTSGNPDSYSWDFGDLSSSTQPNPTHTYVASGLYVVRLTATKNGVSSTIAKAVPIQAGTVGFTLMTNNAGAVLTTPLTSNQIAAIVG